MNKSVDLTYLKEITGGADFIIKEMLELFLSETPQQLDIMEKKCQNEEWDRVRAEAHKVKPTFLYVGLQAAYENIGTIEMSAKNEENLDSIAGLIDTVQKEFQNVAPEVKSLIKEYS